MKMNFRVQLDLSYVYFQSEFMAQLFDNYTNSESLWSVQIDTKQDTEFGVQYNCPHPVDSQIFISQTNILTKWHTLSYVS